MLRASAAHSDQIGQGWTTVKRGEVVLPVEFTKQGVVLFHEGRCRLEIEKEDDETTTEIQFSPASPNGEYRVVIGDVYDFQPAYLVDVKKCGVMHLSLPRYFQPWASWSPDGKTALFYTDYEASPQLWLLKLDTGQIFEVHHDGLKLRADTCCGLNEWVPASGVAYLVRDSLHWKDATNFSLKLEVFCNPYSEGEGWPCDKEDGDYPRAAYQVSICLEPEKVATGPRVNLPPPKELPKKR